jgi:hypothetical protein
MNTPQTKDLIRARRRLPTIALSVMLIALLLPTLSFSMRRTPASVTELVAITSVTLLASVLSLWIMDAIGLLQFRYPWMSKTIYTATIASLLAVSVSIYKSSSDSRRFPYEGPWRVRIIPVAPNGQAVDTEMILAYSEAGNYYWGFSRHSKMQEDLLQVMWIEMIALSVDESRATLQICCNNGTSTTKEWEIDLKPGLHQVISSKSLTSGDRLEMRRR